MKTWEKLGAGLIGSVVFLAMQAGISVVTGFLVMLLWNWLLPDIFKVPEISWIQGWGIAMLSSVLFKSK
jgi:hypothetical protein